MKLEYLGNDTVKSVTGTEIRSRARDRTRRTIPHATDGLTTHLLPGRWTGATDPVGERMATTRKGYPPLFILYLDLSHDFRHVNSRAAVLY